ncbi:lipoprotein [Pseudomonadota bacterium]
MNKSKLPLLLCTLMLFVVACGQRGPLYLPESGQTRSPAEDRQAESAEEEKEEENEEAPGT